MGWHEDDRFWTAIEPGLFPPSRLADAPREAEALVRLLRLSPGARILDLCAGTGRHAIELAARGFPVTAVDRTEAFLRQANARARARGVMLELVHADMRDFVRPGAFDAVLNLYTSFGYFEAEEDNLRAAKNMCQSLAPGGAAVLDLVSKETVGRHFLERSWLENRGCFFLEQRSIDRDWTRLRTRIVVLGDGAQRELLAEHRLYSGEELRALLLEAGFSTVALHGGFDGRPFDGTADLLLAIARP